MGDDKDVDAYVRRMARRDAPFFFIFVFHCSFPKISIIFNGFVIDYCNTLRKSHEHSAERTSQKAMTAAMIFEQNYEAFLETHIMQKFRKPQCIRRHAQGC